MVHVVGLRTAQCVQPAEFLQRRESVSGVQRVIAEVAPILADSAGAGVHAAVLDRGRGAFVALEPAEQQVLWREDVTAAMLEEAGTAAGAEGLYRSAHTHMTMFIATHATAIVAERYRELKRAALPAGGGV